MIRKRAELDTDNPPGQVVNATGAVPRPTHVPTLNKSIDEFKQSLFDTEEMFTPEPKREK